MEGVPKILKPLVSEWTKEGYVVSFKVRPRLPPPSLVLRRALTDRVRAPCLQLETDPDLLLPKARGALDKYGHQLVIGNDLHRRKFEVVFVEPSSGEAGAGAEPYRESWLRLPEGAVERGVEIEETIVRELVERHGRWIGDTHTR